MSSVTTLHGLEPFESHVAIAISYCTAAVYAYRRGGRPWLWTVWLGFAVVLEIVIF
jgi:hypothetical protein